MEGDCNVYAHSSLWMRPTRPDRYNMRMVYRSVNFRCLLRRLFLSNLTIFTWAFHPQETTFIIPIRPYIVIRPFYKARAPLRLTQERPKCALHHGKMSTNKCRARYEITHEHVSNDLKMWIKRLHTEIHNIMTIYIHYKSIYFKIITCIILRLVNSNVFACKTNSAFNDFVDSCVTGKRNRTGARAL